MHFRLRRGLQLRQRHATSGAVKLIKDLDQPIEGTQHHLVEDILDTGLTLCFLKRMLLQHQPRRCGLPRCLDKPERRIEPIQADYVGFSIPNHFVIGYGMDYAERFRNLPDICIADAARLFHELHAGLGIKAVPEWDAVSHEPH